MSLQSDGRAVDDGDDLGRQIRELAPWFHNLHLPDGRQTARERVRAAEVARSEAVIGLRAKAQTESPEVASMRNRGVVLHLEGVLRVCAVASLRAATVIAPATRDISQVSVTSDGGGAAGGEGAPYMGSATGLPPSVGTGDATSGGGSDTASAATVPEAATFVLVVFPLLAALIVRLRG